MGRGQYVDQSKRQIRLNDEQLRKLVNQTLLPQPAGSVEDLADWDKPIFISDPPAEHVIRTHRGVNPAGFYFRPEAGGDVVQTIRHRLVDSMGGSHRVDVPAPQLPEEAAELLDRMAHGMSRWEDPAARPKTRVRLNYSFAGSVWQDAASREIRCSGPLALIRARTPLPRVVTILVTMDLVGAL